VTTKIHRIEIGRSVHSKGDMPARIVYLNDIRIHGGKPWGGFVAESTFEIRDDDLREALKHT
jgi:hypothetical protein